MNIPTPYITRSKLFGDIMNEAKDKPNDMDLGRAIRSLMREYAEGKHNPPSTIELDEDTNKKP